MPNQISGLQQNIFYQGESFWGNSYFESLFGALSRGAVYGTGPDENGWTEYLSSNPPKNVLLQFRRRDSCQDFTWIDYNDFHPEFNVANLYWRLTGIGRHQLEGE
jgi:hypothetical protein